MKSGKGRGTGGGIQSITLNIQHQPDTDGVAELYIYKVYLKCSIHRKGGSCILLEQSMGISFEYPN